MVTASPATIATSGPASAVATSVQDPDPEQAGRAPQAMPWALKASQIRHPFGVPFERLPSSSSTARYTVYQLDAPQPFTTADGLHCPPDATWYALLVGVRLSYQIESMVAHPAVAPWAPTSDCARSQLAELAMWLSQWPW